ncbi:FeoB-associated Cys-rich membrane protein [Clostridiales bacterium COT073_COT-073]|nr:FeoB-associated Cys-rich membrane protein [Clostridiales bacterium COT073_COT-073]
MMEFIVQNGGTIFVLLLLIAMVVFVAYHLTQNHKQGKSSCGCGCGGCDQAGCATAHMVENLQSEMKKKK